MLTNPRNAVRGQSRSPNIVTFHMFGTVSYYCEILTVISDIRLQKCRDLEIGVIQGHRTDKDRSATYDFLFLLVGWKMLFFRHLWLLLPAVWKSVPAFHIQPLSCWTRGSRETPVRPVEWALIRRLPFLTAEGLKDEVVCSHFVRYCCCI